MLTYVALLPGRLRASGLDAVIAEELLAEHLGHSEFDMIFILNVLDRCKDPFSMLEQAHALLPPDGWLVVSVVLPAFQADAADGVGGEQRTWRVVGQDFETATASLVRDAPIGRATTHMHTCTACMHACMHMRPSHDDAVCQLAWCDVHGSPRSLGLWLGLGLGLSLIRAVARVRVGAIAHLGLWLGLGLGLA